MAIAEGVGAGGAAASAAASAEAKSARAAWAQKKPGSNASPKPPAPPLRSPSKGVSPRTPIARQSTGVLQLGDGRKVSVTNSKAKDGDDE